jgi:DNA-binding CsgD family transcriptional regulator
MSVGGLDEPDARALLSRAVPGRLHDAVGDRLIAETRGNPLALLELARSMTAPERAGGYALPAAADVPTQVEEQYLRRVDALPEATRLLVLLAAADPLGDATLLWRAADLLSVAATAAAPAAAAGLLEIDDHVRFRHPLVRSAVYRAASPDDRQRAHRALAEVSDPELDADRRAWHLATAASGPDEDIAVELERSAGRAQTRGGLAAAGAFLQRAVALTEDSPRRAERALAAARVSVQAGAFDTALGLVATAEVETLDESQSAQADLLRGHVALASGGVSEAARLLLRAASRLESSDPRLARETYLAAMGAAFLASQRAILEEICRALQALPPGAGPPAALDLLLEGLALLTSEGHASATPTLQRAATALADIPVEDVLRWGWMATAASNAVWDNDGALAISTRQVRLVRDAGALAELPLYLAAFALASAWTGDLPGAASAVAEADSVAAATGSGSHPGALLRVLALQGRDAEALAAIERTIEQAAVGAQGLAPYAYWAAAVLHNGRGRYEEATAAARRATPNPVEHWVSVWVLPELVEAAARAGDAELACDALERLVQTTQPCATDAALGLEARSRALVTDDAAAEELYREAIDRLSRTQLRPEVARARLVFGEWLCHERRLADAREQLRAADGMFATIGMEAFAERGRRALLAAGAKVPKQTVETYDQLTPQEGQIARLARGELTNAEIGAQLFLSPRTVEWHLHKVFAKLRISSRSDLRAALTIHEPDAAREPSTPT